MDDNSFRQLVESINNLEEGKKPKHWKGTDKGKPKKDQFVGESGEMIRFRPQNQDHSTMEKLWAMEEKGSVSFDGEWFSAPERLVQQLPFEKEYPSEMGEDDEGGYGFLSKYVAEEELEEDLVSQMKKEMGNYLKSRKDVEEEGSKPKPFNHTPKIGKDIQKPKGVKTITSKEDGMLTDDENVEENSHRDRLVKKAMKPITDKEKMFPKKDKEEKKVKEAGLKPSASAQAYMSQMDDAHAQQDAYYRNAGLGHAPDKKYKSKVNGDTVVIEWEPMFLDNGEGGEDAWVATGPEGKYDLGTGSTPKEALAAFKEINGLNEGILDKAKDFVGWDETDDERKEREATDRAYAKHRAKKKMKKNGVTVRDVHPSELMDSEGDHEVSMAHSQTQSIIHHIEELDSMIEAMDADDELQAWFQSKLAIANDYITKMTHYLKHKTEHPVESKVPEESMDDMAYFQECVDTLVKHGVDENNAIEFVREQRKKALDNNK